MFHKSPPTLGRQILAVIVGLLASFMVVAIVEWVGHRMYPVPEGFDFTGDEAVIREFIANLPVGALLMVLLAWTLGVGVGCSAARLIVGMGSSRWPCRIVGTLFLLLTLTNLWMIPHPTWFGMLAIVLVGGLTALLSKNPRNIPAAA